MKKMVFLVLFFGAIFSNANIFDNELKLCEKGDMKSCNFVINYYYPSPDTYKQMWDLIGKLCLNGDDEKCEIITKRGEYDKAKIEILEKSCNNKNIKSCKNLSNFYHSRRQESELLSIYERLCEFGDKEGCSEAIWAKFAKLDNSENLDFLDEKCNQEIDSACFILGSFYAFKGIGENFPSEDDKKVAMNYYLKACKYSKFGGIGAFGCSSYREIEKMFEK